MNITIRYKNLSMTDSRILGELETEIKRCCDVNVIREEANEPQPHQKNSELIGLTIAGFVITSIDTLINILSYLVSKKGKYSVSFVIGESTYSLEADSAEEILKMENKIRELNPPKIQILLLDK